MGTDKQTCERMEIIFADKGLHQKHIFNKLSNTSGIVKKKYEIAPIEDRNPMNNMHGGRIATLLDISTSKSIRKITLYSSHRQTASL